MGMRDEKPARTPSISGEGTLSSQRASPVRRPWTIPTARIPYRLAITLSQTRTKERVDLIFAQGHQGSDAVDESGPISKQEEQDKECNHGLSGESRQPPHQQRAAGHERPAGPGWQGLEPGLDPGFLKIDVPSDPVHGGVQRVGRELPHSSRLAAPLRKVSSGSEHFRAHCSRHESCREHEQEQDHEGRQ